MHRTRIFPRALVGRMATLRRRAVRLGAGRIVPEEENDPLSTNFGKLLRNISNESTKNIGPNNINRIVGLLQGYENKKYKRLRTFIPPKNVTTLRSKLKKAINAKTKATRGERKALGWEQYLTQSGASRPPPRKEKEMTNKERQKLKYGALLEEIKAEVKKNPITTQTALNEARNLLKKHNSYNRSIRGIVYTGNVRKLVARIKQGINRLTSSVIAKRREPITKWVTKNIKTLGNVEEVEELLAEYNKKHRGRPDMLNRKNIRVIRAKLKKARQPPPPLKKVQTQFPPSTGDIVTGKQIGRAHV